MLDSPVPGGPQRASTPPVYLHIGAMKTGTTFLQDLMFHNKERLAAAGYLFPGENWGRQVRAAQDVLHVSHEDPRIGVEAPGAWQALAREMLAHEGHASVFSHEFLSFADAKQARRTVTSLHPAEVHVILTVRDAVATIPAQWQTTVRSGRTISWPDFMRGIRKATTIRGRWGRFSGPALVRFRRAQDIARIVRNWRHAVPPERLHVVTVPPVGSDPLLLWERFADVLGVDPSVCSIPPARANESLGYPSTEFLRRVNLELGQLQPTDYSSTVRDYLAARVLSELSSEETRARLDTATYSFGLEWNRRMRAALLAEGVTVSGDLEDLPTAMKPVHQRYVDDAQRPPTDPELLAVAGFALEPMQALVTRRARRARKRGLQVEMPGYEAGGGPAAWRGSSDPVEAAAAEIADLCRTAVDLKQRLDGRLTPRG